MVRLRSGKPLTGIGVRLAPFLRCMPSRNLSEAAILNFRTREWLLQSNRDSLLIARVRICLSWLQASGSRAPGRNEIEQSYHVARVQRPLGGFAGFCEPGTLKSAHPFFGAPILQEHQQYPGLRIYHFDLCCRSWRGFPERRGNLPSRPKTNPAAQPTVHNQESPGPQL